MMTTRYLFPTPESDQASYLIEVDGQDYEVVPVETSRSIEARMREYRDELDQIERWNDNTDFDDDNWENWDRAMELLHNRHSKFDLARLIADLLGGKTPKVLR